MFMNTHMTAPTMLANPAWIISSSLATCVYSVVVRNCQTVTGNVKLSKMRQRHTNKDMRSEDPQMRH